MAPNRMVSLALALVGASALAIGVSACGGGKKRDPCAGGVPNPVAPEVCILEFQGASATDTDAFNLFQIQWDGDEADWTGANPGDPNTQTYNVGPVALSAFELKDRNGDGQLRFTEARVLTAATGGTVDIAACGYEEADSVSFDDTTPQAFGLLTTNATGGLVFVPDGFQANAGQGSFDGVFSIFDPGSFGDLTIGTGQVTIVGTNGSTVTIISDETTGFGYAYCLPPGFAPRARVNGQLMRWRDVPARRPLFR